MSDIVERLRDCYENWGLGSKGPIILKDAADEIERLRSGIKRLSDEEELCAETTGDDPFSMVYLAAKLAATEAALATAEPALAQQPLSVPKPYGHIVEMYNDTGTTRIAWRRSRVQWSLMDAERTAAEWQSMVNQCSFLSGSETRIIPLFAAPTVGGEQE